MKTNIETKTINIRTFELSEDEALALRQLLGAMSQSKIIHEIEENICYVDLKEGNLLSGGQAHELLSDVYYELCKEFDR